MTDQTEIIRIFSSAVELLNMEGQESTLREEYSGRAMYGRTCPGIVSDACGTLVGACVYQAAMDELDDEYEAMRLVPRRSDSMGLSSIYY